MVTPAVQLGSLGSVGLARFGNCRLPPPSVICVQQLWAMFQGLPPLSTVFPATIDPRRLTFAPPQMPPPTQSAKLSAMVRCWSEMLLLALSRMAPPSPVEPLLGRRPLARLPVKVLLRIEPLQLSSSHSAPPCPTVWLPVKVERSMVRPPFWW